MKFNYLKLGLLAGAIVATAGCQDEDEMNPQAQTITLDCANITEETTLIDLGTGVDYIVPCMIRVDAGLIIEPGVTIEFAQDAGLVISDYDTREGYLVAEGTADNPVTFTGRLKQAGAWEGIDIESTDLRNSVNHCVIEYAGGQNAERGAVRVMEGDLLQLSNCTLRNNSSYGLFTKKDCNLSGYSLNTFVDNGNYPVHLAANTVRYLDGSSSSYTGNSIDEIYVFSSSIYDRGFIEGTNAHVWKDPGVEYYVNEMLYVGQVVYGHLQIDAGVTINFGEDFGLDVSDNNGLIEVLGTETNGVVFQGRNGMGSWKGILVNTNNSQNAIRFASIEDAGQSDWGVGFNGATGALSLGYPTTDVSLVLQNVHISNSAGCGILEASGTTVNLTQSNVSYSGNTGDDYCDLP